jgi:hypothetical protein
MIPTHLIKALDFLSEDDRRSFLTYYKDYYLGNRLMESWDLNMFKAFQLNGEINEMDASFLLGSYKKILKRQTEELFYECYEYNQRVKVKLKLMSVVVNGIIGSTMLVFKNSVGQEFKVNLFSYNNGYEIRGFDKWYLITAVVSATEQNGRVVILKNNSIKGYKYIDGHSRN